MEQKWPQEIWLVRHGQSAGNVARDAAEAASGLRIDIAERDVDVPLSALNLPVALAGLLISIEPLIDMGRTALNVSGSITAGTFASRVLGQTDWGLFNTAL